MYLKFWPISFVKLDTLVNPVKCRTSVTLLRSNHTIYEKESTIVKWGITAFISQTGRDMRGGQHCVVF